MIRIIAKAVEIRMFVEGIVLQVFVLRYSCDYYFKTVNEM